MDQAKRKDTVELACRSWYTSKKALGLGTEEKPGLQGIVTLPDNRARAKCLLKEGLRADDLVAIALVFCRKLLLRVGVCRKPCDCAFTHFQCPLSVIESLRLPETNHRQVQRVYPKVPSEPGAVRAGCLGPAGQLPVAASGGAMHWSSMYQNKPKRKTSQWKMPDSLQPLGPIS